MSELVGTSTCNHTWVQTEPVRRVGGIFDGLRVSSFLCSACGVLWPGCPLPEPAHEREGYGHVADQPGFSRRLRDALAAIPDG